MPGEKDNKSKNPATTAKSTVVAAPKGPEETPELNNKNGEKSPETTTAPAKVVKAAPVEAVKAETTKYRKIRWMQNHKASIGGTEYHGTKDKEAQVPENVAFILQGSQKAVIVN